MSTTLATARITAGQLTQRITLQSRAAGADVLGQASGAWTTVAEVWAKARPLRSRELFAAGQMQNVTDVEFTIRWRTDVGATWRVLWRGTPHDITGEPIDVDGQQQWLELMAASGLRDGRS
jgi:SPP1 family predicted phage head-tail adaptor